MGALFVLIIAFLLGCGSDDPKGSSGDSAAESTPPPEDRCFDLWNDAEENIGKEFASLLAQGGSGTAYVSVGFGATFPDRCLVTIASPDIDSAQQYREASAQEAGFGAFSPAGNGTISDLPESVTAWNATVNKEGDLVAGAP
jgi:hypothetical protein